MQKGGREDGSEVVIYPFQRFSSDFVYWEQLELQFHWRLHIGFSNWWLRA